MVKVSLVCNMLFTSQKNNTMMKLYADLHIHIGSAVGSPVKITASRRLTIKNIILEAPRKGLDIVGIVDAGCTGVAQELVNLLDDGFIYESSDGGFIAYNGVLVIPGCEIESREGVHLIIYLPSMQAIGDYIKLMKNKMKNQFLSTQRTSWGIVDIIDLARYLRGIFCPAHAFTPHKGIYGMLTPRLKDCLPAHKLKIIQALELGLSADTYMADMIAETGSFTFLSNSDAHSLEKIGREYNLMAMGAKNFKELSYCIEQKQDCKIVANYGLNPLLGKYHRSYCDKCNTIASDIEPVLVCQECGNDRVINGVWDRIQAIKDYEQPQHPFNRPPYYYRVPLIDLPGLGRKTVDKLISHLGSELRVLEESSLDEIERVAGPKVTRIIDKMRQGILQIIPGGGGYYGKVQKDYCYQ